MTKAKKDLDAAITLDDSNLSEAERVIASFDETVGIVGIGGEVAKIELAPNSFHTEIAKKEKRVLDKYKTLIAELTKEEELEVLGLSLKQAFPPIERDVEKLVVDLNVVIYKYMQMKMEQDNDVRVETIRSTVQTSLRKISAALLTMMGAEDK